MDEIVGQDRAIEVLQAALQSGRLHHAYVFHGPAGVGKFTTACAFGKILLCHDPQRDLAGRVIACEGCPSCKLLTASAVAVAAAAAGGNAGLDENDQVEEPEDEPASRSKPKGPGKSGGASPGALGAPSSGPIHPDFLVVTKELARFSEDANVRKRKLITIPVDVLQEQFINPIYRAPQLRHNKVLIIDEAELIDSRGQNLLLKTLEEPPAGVYLILVTSSEDKLLPTIRSRCQRVAFLPLPEAQIEKWLEPRAKDLTDPQRKWLADFAAGSLGRASLALEYGLAAWAQAVLPMLDHARQGRYPAGAGALVAQMINDFAERWVKAHAGASKEAANKLAATLMWSMIAQHARGKVAQLAKTTPADDLGAAEAVLGPWLGVIDALAEAEAELAANVNMGLVCDHLFSVVHRALTPAA